MRVTACVHITLRDCEVLVMAEVVTDLEVVEEVVEDFSEEQGARIFKVGLRFTTYEELSEKINEYEKANMVKLWKRNSRTVESVKKRLDRPLCPDKVLQYHIFLHSWWKEI